MKTLLEDLQELVGEYEIGKIDHKTLITKLKIINNYYSMVKQKS
jgi:hypothetical protein